MNTHGKKHILFFIFLFFMGVYILTSSGSIHGTIDGTVRFAVTKSIVDSGNVSIPEDLGRDNGVMGIDGKYYSWYGIGQSALMIPLYVISKAAPNPEFLVSLFNPLISAITCVIIFLFCVRLGYSSRTSVIVTLMYGLGTIAWPQSKGPFEHPLETILILLSVFFIHLHAEKRSYLKLILSSVFLGIAFITRSPSLLALPPLLLYLLFSYMRKKTILPFLKEAIIYGMTLVPFGVFYLYYNYVRFGDVFETGYSKIFNQWGVEPFGTPLHVGLYGLILSPGKGFFLYSPIAILFVLAVRNFYKKNKELTIVFLTLISAYVLFHSKYIIWHGDWAWGPRYLTALTPFLMLPLGELFENGLLRKSLFIKVAVTLLFTISILIQLSAVTVNLNKYFIKNQIPPRNIPNHIYFEPRYSPIKEQFKFVVEIAKKIRYYTPPPPLPSPFKGEGREGVTDTKAINEQITINVPDFWYVYYIYAGAPRGSLTGMVIILLVLIAFSFTMILEKGIGNGEWGIGKRKYWLLAISYWLFPILFCGCASVPENAQITPSLPSREEKTAPTHKFVGNQCYASGRYGIAVEEFKQAIIDNEDDVEAYLALGRSYREMGNYEEAIKTFNEGLSLGMNTADFHVAMGITYDLQGNYPLAIPEYEKAIKQSPKNEEAYNNMGFSYFLQGKFDDAIASYKKAIEINPENKRAHNNLGYIYGKQEHYDTALDEFKLAVDEAEAYNNLGYIYYMDGKNEKAISTFKKALQLNPNLEKAHSNLEKLQQTTGK